MCVERERVNVYTRWRSGDRGKQFGIGRVCLVVNGGVESHQRLGLFLEHFGVEVDGHVLDDALTQAHTAMYSMMPWQHTRHY